MSEAKILFHNNLDYLEKKVFIDATIDREYIFDKLYIEYQKRYNSNCNYQNIGFEISDNKNKLFCPLTLENNGLEKNLNFFGKPIVICNGINFDNVFKKELMNIFSKLIEENSIKNFIYKMYTNKSDIENVLKNESEIIDAIYTENRIDLEQPLNKILNDFTKGHKSSVKKEYKELSYHIYDHTNYKKNQILEMMTLHETVTNKKTRSKQTWLANEEMIINKQGFLVKVLDNGKLISYAFFFHNKFYAIYFSSCTNRETFNSFKNITHKTIWKSIEYLKNIKCKYLTLGHTNTLYYKNNIVDKRSNIERFTASFGGHQQNYIVYKRIPKII